MRRPSAGSKAKRFWQSNTRMTNRRRGCCNTPNTEYWERQKFRLIAAGSSYIYEIERTKVTSLTERSLAYF